jgi:hypothetical protein
MMQNAVMHFQNKDGQATLPLVPPPKLAGPSDAAPTNPSAHPPIELTLELEEQERLASVIDGADEAYRASLLLVPFLKQTFARVSQVYKKKKKQFAKWDGELLMAFRDPTQDQVGNQVRLIVVIVTHCREDTLGNFEIRHVAKQAFKKIINLGWDGSKSGVIRDAYWDICDAKKMVARGDVEQWEKVDKRGDRVKMSARQMVFEDRDDNRRLVWLYRPYDQPGGKYYGQVKFCTLGKDAIVKITAQIAFGKALTSAKNGATPTSVTDVASDETPIHRRSCICAICKARTSRTHVAAHIRNINKSVTICELSQLPGEDGLQSIGRDRIEMAVAQLNTTITQRAGDDNGKHIAAVYVTRTSCEAKHRERSSRENVRCGRPVAIGHAEVQLIRHLREKKHGKGQAVGDEGPSSDSAPATRSGDAEARREPGVLFVSTCPCPSCVIWISDAIDELNLVAVVFGDSSAVGVDGLRTLLETKVKVYHVPTLALGAVEPRGKTWIGCVTQPMGRSRPFVSLKRVSRLAVDFLRNQPADDVVLRSLETRLSRHDHDRKNFLLPGPNRQHKLLFLDPARLSDDRGSKWLSGLREDLPIQLASLIEGAKEKTTVTGEQTALHGRHLLCLYHDHEKSVFKVKRNPVPTHQDIKGHCNQDTLPMQVIKQARRRHRDLDMILDTPGPGVATAWDKEEWKKVTLGLLAAQVAARGTDVDEARDQRENARAKKDEAPTCPGNSPAPQSSPNDSEPVTERQVRTPARPSADDVTEGTSRAQTPSPDAPSPDAQSETRAAADPEPYDQIFTKLARLKSVPHDEQIKCLLGPHMARLLHTRVDCMKQSYVELRSMMGFLTTAALGTVDQQEQQCTKSRLFGAFKTIMARYAQRSDDPDIVAREEATLGDEILSALNSTLVQSNGDALTNDSSSLSLLWQWARWFVVENYQPWWLLRGTGEHTTAVYLKRLRTWSWLMDPDNGTKQLLGGRFWRWMQDQKTPRKPGDQEGMVDLVKAELTSLAARLLAPNSTPKDTAHTTVDLLMKHHEAVESFYADKKKAKKSKANFDHNGRKKQLLAGRRQRKCSLLADGADCEGKVHILSLNITGDQGDRVALDKVVVQDCDGPDDANPVVLTGELETRSPDKFHTPGSKRNVNIHLKHPPEGAAETLRRMARKQPGGRSQISVVLWDRDPKSETGLQCFEAIVKVICGGKHNSPKMVTPTGYEKLVRRLRLALVYNATRLHLVRGVGTNDLYQDACTKAGTWDDVCRNLHAEDHVRNEHKFYLQAVAPFFLNLGGDDDLRNSHLRSEQLAAEKWRLRSEIKKHNPKNKRNQQGSPTASNVHMPLPIRSTEDVRVLVQIDKVKKWVRPWFQNDTEVKEEYQIFAVWLRKKPWIDRGRRADARGKRGAPETDSAPANKRARKGSSASTPQPDKGGGGMYFHFQRPRAVTLLPRTAALWLDQLRVIAHNAPTAAIRHAHLHMGWKVRRGGLVRIRIPLQQGGEQTFRQALNSIKYTPPRPQPGAHESSPGTNDTEVDEMSIHIRDLKAEKRQLLIHEKYFVLHDPKKTPADEAISMEVDYHEKKCCKYALSIDQQQQQAQPLGCLEDLIRLRCSGNPRKLQEFKEAQVTITCRTGQLSWAQPDGWTKAYRVATAEPDDELPVPLAEAKMDPKEKPAWIQSWKKFDKSAAWEQGFDVRPEGESGLFSNLEGLLNDIEGQHKGCASIDCKDHTHGERKKTIASLIKRRLDQEFAARCRRMDALGHKRVLTEQDVKGGADGDLQAKDGRSLLQHGFKAGTRGLLLAQVSRRTNVHALREFLSKNFEPEVVALFHAGFEDPGERTFVTVYDLWNGVVWFGGDGWTDKQYRTILRPIDQIKSIRDKGLYRNQVSKEQERAFNDSIARKWRQLERNRHKLHKTIAQLYGAMFTLIVRPDFRTKGMTRKHRRISAHVSRRLRMLGFYDFKLEVQRVCANTGLLALTVNEFYTSKICGSCAYYHRDLGGSKVFTCPKCDVTEDRGQFALLLRNSGL